MVRRHARGFTIVELLTVIAIIVLLIGLLLPALAGVRTSSQKTRELNSLRQVAVAWTLYANNSGEYVLPGEIGAATNPAQSVQARWQVRYDYPRGEMISPAIAAHWPWRLAPMMDNALEALYGYAEIAGHDHFLLKDGNNPNTIDTNGNSVPDAVEFATQPAFGYNGYYIGGVWKMFEVGGNIIPRYQFYDARADVDRDGTIGNDEFARVTAISMGQIRRPDRLVLFAASFLPGEDPLTSMPMSGIEYERLAARSSAIPGCDLITPANLAGTQCYDLYGQNSAANATELTLEVDSAPPGGLEWGVPLGRYNGTVATAHPDGSTETLLPGTFVDQTRFIDIAEFPRWEHE